MRTWDIFCTVVDNYGDIGVCWRLARQLAAERGLRVRLWVDDLASFRQDLPGHRDRPGVAAQPRRGSQVVARALSRGRSGGRGGRGIRLQSAGELCRGDGGEAAETGVDQPRISERRKLGARLPRAALAASVAAAGEAFLLSRVSSPAPAGCWRSAGWRRRASGFRAPHAEQARFWKDLGLPAPRAGELQVSLFCYPHDGDQRTAAGLGGRRRAGALPGAGRDCDGRPCRRSSAAASLAPGAILRKASLEVRIFPFLDQDQYDRLLWACDLNLVRGEDSFVRAQWAARPLLWQIYPQQEGAHWPKLQAFLGLYCAGPGGGDRGGAHEIVAGLEPGRRVPRSKRPGRVSGSTGRSCRRMPGAGPGSWPQPAISQIILRSFAKIC